MTDFPHPTFGVVEEIIDEQTSVLTVQGEIHVSTAPEFSEHINTAIAAGRVRLALDFAAVEFIDSTGLSVLLNALRRVSRRDGALSVACTNPTVLRLFEITRLDSTFAIVASLEEALAHVRGSSEAGAP